MSRLGFCAAFFVMASAADAWAQSAVDKPGSGLTGGSRTNDAKASAYRAEGEDYVKADDCKGALDPLRSAWGLRQDGKTAVLLGECELRLGMEPEAAHHLTRAVELLPEGAERTRIESMLRDVSSRVARLDVVVNQPGAVVVVGKFVVDTPVEALFVAPGDVAVVVKKTGFGEQQRHIKATAGGTVRVEFTLTRAGNDTALDHPEKQHDGMSKIPTYVGAGLALASIGAGIGLRIAGTDSGNQADALLGELVGKPPCKMEENQAGCSELLNLRLEHDRFVNASTGLFVTGGILLGGAFVYTMVASRKTRDNVAILPVVSPSNNGLFIQGRF